MLLYFLDFLALLTSILAGKSGCSPLNISENAKIKKWGAPRAKRAQPAGAGGSRPASRASRAAHPIFCLVCLFCLFCHKKQNTQCFARLKIAAKVRM